MIIKDTICYTRLLEMMKRGDFIKSVKQVTYDPPNLDAGEFIGAYDTKVVFDVHDIELFTKSYMEVLHESFNSDIGWYFTNNNWIGCKRGVSAAKPK